MTAIEEQKRAEEALRLSERKFRDLVDILPVGIYTCDADGYITYFNRKAVEVWGVEPGPGKKGPKYCASLRLFRSDHSFLRHDQSPMADALRTGQPQQNIQVFVERRDHSLLAVIVNIALIKNERGEILGAINCVQDITRHNEIVRALEESRSDLAEAQSITKIGNWSYDVEKDRISWSDEIYRIFHLSKSEFEGNHGSFISRIHPEDRNAVLLANQQARINGTPFNLEYRILLPNDEMKNIHEMGYASRNAEGRVTRLFGTAQDVTERKQTEAALQKAFGEIQILKDQLYKENLALKEEIDRSPMFGEIIGESRALKDALARAAKVAPTDSTVLLTGETGTGKELIARAIHKSSLRSNHAFVNVNSAAIPASLIGSELFGHEKGAFTGALQRRLGRFELAERGTIFLDEVGELPFETQLALLRVLQDREFERIGGSQSIHADVRVIAATNRDLQSAIDAGTFRSDLFYRLNVFPIEIPPLRERKEDIPILVQYFIDRYSFKVGKKIKSVDKRTLDRLISYSWPGNVRELQNIIERSLIVCETDTLIVDQSWLNYQPLRSRAGDGKLTRKPAVVEKRMIEDALAETRGKISGPDGAAAKLGIPPSTLESKIKSLEIKKSRFKKIY